MTVYYKLRFNDTSRNQEASELIHDREIPHKDILFYFLTPKKTRNRNIYD